MQSRVGCYKVYIYIYIYIYIDSTNMAGAVVAVSAVGRAAGRYRLRVHSLSPLAFRPCLVSQCVWGF